MMRVFNGALHPAICTVCERQNAPTAVVVHLGGTGDNPSVVFALCETCEDDLTRTIGTVATIAHRYRARG